ncbi:hypothetical protein GHT06_009235 [Daphnia sinensis]|uniref:Uncharacterized protein n=1 Tax=Daphnia sinensis TaxID=1820382 RepID=A0AAD5LWM6_9CRUS|nr:hypothetical protein GHT06_009235 [Daphnia sinensis]
MSSTSPMSASAGGGNGNRRRGVFSLGKCRLPVVGSPNVQQQHLIDSSNSGGGVRAVKYTPRGHPSQQQADTSLLHGYSHANSRENGQQDDELEEIAVVSVVSGVQSGQLTYGSAGSSMANGPRVVPGNFQPSSRRFLSRSCALCKRSNGPHLPTLRFPRHALVRLFSELRAYKDLISPPFSTRLHL